MPWPVIAVHRARPQPGPARVAQCLQSDNGPGPSSLALYDQIGHMVQYFRLQPVQVSLNSCLEILKFMVLIVYTRVLMILEGCLYIIDMAVILTMFCVFY